jgi:hypothetical protein
MTAPTDHSQVRVGGRYRLDERIGAGAMGAVWRATDELLNRTVAVKELLLATAPATAAGSDALEESRQRLMREGRIGARLQHPHVISMFDVVVHDDRPWLVMEYLPSRSLAAVLGEKGPLPAIEVAEIGRQVADGLAAAHLAGVVHRDVKPGNVLIAEDGRVKLTDFGVSRAVDDVQLTRTGLIAGTPAFLSPEVARGLDPTAASDVFALGATLYAAVEGIPPYGLDDNAYALLHKVATEQVRPPKREGPVMDVIMRLLSREPEDRPSAAQAREALAAVAAGRDTGLAAAAPTPGTTAVLGPSAPPAPARQGPPTRAGLPRPTPPPRRNRRVLVLLGVLGVTLAAGAGIMAAVLTNTTGDDQGGAPVAQPTPTATAPATTPPPTTAASAVPSDSIAFVLYYYDLLPENLDAAWSLLSPAAQEASGGRANFDAFYGNLRNVWAEDLRRTAENTVEARVVFLGRDGNTTTEPYRFVMGTGANGQLIMESFSRL